MADKNHLRMLARGVKSWNAWRKRSRVKPDLRRALLVDRELRGINLAGANLEGAILRGTTLSRANLARANLRRADLRTTSLRRARLDHADLTAAILRFASLAETSVEGTVFEGCDIYGIAAWNLDITDPSSIPHELAAIVPDLPSVPVVPLILASERPYAMFEHLQRYGWVLPVVRYKDTAELLRKLPKAVIEKAEKKAKAQTRSPGRNA